MSDLPLPPNDHDILILLAERVRALTEKIENFTTEVSNRLGAIEIRVSELEKKAERQAGFWAGANWIKGMLLAAPPAVVAFLLGKGGMPGS